MTTPKWQSGHLYFPGDLVQPVTVPAAGASQVVNGDFSAGATGWDYTGGCAYTAGNTYSGAAGSCYVPGSAASGEAINQTQLATTPGASITARCVIEQGASDVDHTRGWVIIRWYDASDQQIGPDETGNVVDDGRNGAWHPSTVTAVAPPSTAYARAGIGLYQNSNDAVWGDNLSITSSYTAPPEGLIYKAVQAAAGMSAAAEPAWPPVLGQTVVDNEVTWEAVQTSRVVWTASPALISGDTEPVWPESPGGVVADGSIQWEAVSRRVEDENCPNTKVVAILSSKVFAVDRDIVRFSATVDPLDWTTEQDAGYIATGLQQANANDMAVLAPYRSNLAAMNANCFQNWQVDPDPSMMAILDQMDGVGSTWQKAACAVGNELFYLSALGVRTVGIANAAENLAAGDVGTPIDPLVRDAMRQAVIDGVAPRATYFPGAGQYWLAFPPPSVPTGDIVITGEFAEGTIGVEYESGPLTATNAFAPLRWSMTALPAGLDMDSGGTVTGTPTATGTITGDVTVTDRYGRTATVSRTINAVFGSPLAVGATGTLGIYSGDTSAYPIAQSLPLGVETATCVSSANGGTYIARSAAVSPYFRLFKKLVSGGYTEVPTPLDTMPSAAVQQVAVTSDGAYLATAQGTTWRLYKRSGDTFALVQAVTGHSQCVSLKWSGDGEYLAGGSFNGVKLYRRAGDVLSALTYSGGASSGIAWYGHQIANASNATNGGVRVAQIDGDTVTTLATATFSSPENAFIRWSLDGQYLFMGGNSGTDRLRCYQWSGVAFSALTNPTEQPTSPVLSMDLSEDGRVLAVTCGENGKQVRIYTVDGATLTFIGIVGIDADTESARVAFLQSSDHWQP